MPPSTDPKLRVISTWIVLDDETTATNFPQMGVTNSADRRVQAKYWKCIAVLFAVAARTTPDTRFRLYTNAASNLASADEAITLALKKLNVEVVVVPLLHLPPASYHWQWRNQFYILDIIDYICTEQVDADHVVVDSDCLFLRPLDAFFAAIETYGALTLNTGETLGLNINGLTREQMQVLYREMGNCDLASPPEYFGGELFAATSETVKRIQPLAEKAWRDSLVRAEAGLSRLNEEAHLLTYVYYQLGIAPNTANPFMKRLWTNRAYRNGVEADRQLPIVHLPGEKMFGYPILYEAIQDPTSWFYTESNDAVWVAKIQAIMSIPRPTLPRLGIELINSIRNRIDRSLKRKRNN